MTVSRSTLGNGTMLLALLAGAIALLYAQQAPFAWGAPAPARIGWSAAAALAYAAWVALLHRRRTRLAARRRAGATLAASGDTSAAAVTIAHASQTGFGEQLAWQTAHALAAAGTPTTVLPLAALTPAQFASAGRLLLIASTTGEGDPPDGALGFVRHVLGTTPDLSALRYGVLALGDREYAHYCAFGIRLDGWLRHCGAQPLFDRIDVDDGDAGALRHWQHHVGVVSGHTDLPDWQAPRYRPWTLADRTMLNLGSVGGPVFHLQLRPQHTDDAHWRAGDIAEIGPRNANAAVQALLDAAGIDGTVRVDAFGERCTLAAALARSRLPASLPKADPQTLADGLQQLPHREYSIASIPADGTLDLLLRQVRNADGTLGLGSGWLTAYTALGATIDVRIRRNAAFHAPDDDRPLVMIGNGTGIAGLRALLHERIAAGRARNWLLFGERESAYDFHFGDELDVAMRSGMLDRLDTAFSRDAPQRIYVQDRLRTASETLRRWIDDGASVYVCGSVEGMAPGVDTVLRDVLGEAAVERLREEGRYRRDVY